MDLIVELIVQFAYNVAYLPSGRILFGAGFKEHPKSQPLWKRVFAGTFAVFIGSVVVVGLWFLVAYYFT